MVTKINLQGVTDPLILQCHKMTYLLVCFYCLQKKIQMTVIYSGQKRMHGNTFSAKLQLSLILKTASCICISLKYMHDSNNYILLSSTKIHAHTGYVFLPKAMAKFCWKINCISSFYLVHPTAFAMAGFYKKETMTTRRKQKLKLFLPVSYQMIYKTRK